MTELVKTSQEGSSHLLSILLLLSKVVQSVAEWPAEEAKTVMSNTTVDFNFLERIISIDRVPCIVEGLELLRSWLVIEWNAQVALTQCDYQILRQMLPSMHVLQESPSVDISSRAKACMEKVLEALNIKEADIVCIILFPCANFGLGY